MILVREEPSYLAKVFCKYILSLSLISESMGLEEESGLTSIQR